MDTIYRAKPYIPEVTHKWILRKFETILQTGALIQGQHVEEFEKEACRMFDIGDAIATTSCGTGLNRVDSEWNQEQKIYSSNTNICCKCELYY